MNLKNPLKAMVSKFDPNFIPFGEARSSKVLMSCYPCFKSSKSQPSKKEEKQSAHRFVRFESLKFLTSELKKDIPLYN